MDTVTPTAPPTSTAPERPAGPALGFQTLDQEVVIDALPVSGELPGWLAGSLLRTGPARFEVGPDRMRHWFDGLAMLHRFSFAQGRVSYGNRYLESRAYRAASAQGRIVYSEFATDPCRSLFKRVQTMFRPDAGLTDNANVNVSRLGERYVALTETPIPVEFDPGTLRAAGVPPFRAPGQLSTAHPHHDRHTGEMLNYAANLGPRCSYRFFAVDARGGTRVLASLPVREPAYMHSFGLTERHLVLAEFPLVVNPLKLALAGRPYIENYRWRPERGTRFTLVDRASGRTSGPFVAPACFAFHHVNAFERDGEVVVDVCTYPDAQLVADLYLEHLRAGQPLPPSSLTRFRLQTSDRAVTSETLIDGGLELPRINYGRVNEREHRYVWGVDSMRGGFFDQLRKVDIERGVATDWHEPGCFPGEPVFVARPGGGEEDDGVILSVVLDARSERSFLLVLDAASMAERARAGVPHHIPFSFHGQFARDVQP